MDDLFSVAGKTALVTGGARGLGFTYAKALASRGAKVIICDLDEHAVAAAVAELTSYGEIKGYKANVAIEQEVIALVDKVSNELGQLDILINNAGVVQRVTTEDMTLQEWNRVMDVNLTGTFLCCKHFGVMMKRKGKGKIINVSSIAGRMGLDLRLAYCTSKAAIEHLTRTLAAEWGPDHVNINAIGPGYIKTAMNEDTRADPVRYQKMLNQLPWGRFGEPEELVGVLLFLASPASDYVTGQTIFVDGGLLTQ
ncbi:SDR family NAD(P)-dependent oxidoreductase [Ammoniphilus resinae]|uniref:NAD(P)-dependent dehydrogenase (Short-subunit alcohol dehydrogenase family) n=1 Tax=Ammoniphilus resinae TaxID=861532 RepID=A0ABS4GWA5_9BACL|nr:3-oxoacyl-ACP reductase FabG [Ammoniphilus resinae]MBP1934554.1 NAD(P)-dependent dehydrogenase (short-subunit alcohol dehydrogenase family) [Ammoniphilus resinae]